jgi:hypothetical protein
MILVGALVLTGMRDLHGPLWLLGPLPLPSSFGEMLLVPKAYQVAIEELTSPRRDVGRSQGITRGTN